MTPCGGDAFQPTLLGAMTWPNPMCYWCYKAVENGGKCEWIPGAAFYFADDDDYLHDTR